MHCQRWPQLPLTVSVSPSASLHCFRSPRAQPSVALARAPQHHTLRCTIDSWLNEWNLHQDRPMVLDRLERLRTLKVHTQCSCATFRAAPKQISLMSPPNEYRAPEACLWRTWRNEADMCAYVRCEKTSMPPVLLEQVCCMVVRDRSQVRKLTSIFFEQKNLGNKVSTFSQAIAGIVQYKQSEQVPCDGAHRLAEGGWVPPLAHVSMSVLSDACFSTRACVRLCMMPLYDTDVVENNDLLFD